MLRAGCVPGSARDLGDGTAHLRRPAARHAQACKRERFVLCGQPADEAEGPTRPHLHLQNDDFLQPVDVDRIAQGER